MMNVTVNWEQSQETFSIRGGISPGLERLSSGKEGEDHSRIQ